MGLVKNLKDIIRDKNLTKTKLKILNTLKTQNHGLLILHSVALQVCMCCLTPPLESATISNYCTSLCSSLKSLDFRDFLRTWVQIKHHLLTNNDLKHTSMPTTDVSVSPEGFLVHHLDLISTGRGENVSLNASCRWTRLHMETESCWHLRSPVGPDLCQLAPEQTASWLLS